MNSTNPYLPPASDTAAAPFESAQTIPPFVTVGDLLKRSVSFYFANIQTIAAITLVVFVPVEIVKNLLEHAARVEDNIPLTMRVETVIESVFGSLVTAALLSSLKTKIDTGRALSLRDAFSAAGSRWGSVFAARFRSGLFVLVGIVLAIVPGVIWLVRYSLVDEVATLEGGGRAAQTMDRSRALVRGHGWKVFWAGLVSLVVVLTIQFIGGMISGLASVWIVTAMVDSVNDVIYRFFAVLMLLMYLGLGGRGAAPGIRGDQARV
jgi:hypothetical protein